jgi:Mor family transcriptional regulator
MSEAAATKGAQFVRDAVGVIAPQLASRFALSEADALELARNLIHDICSEIGGGIVYIPTDGFYGLTERDQAIFAAHKRGNTHELALQHGLTDMRIRQICAAVLKDIRAKRQMQLPGLD